MKSLSIKKSIIWILIIALVVCAGASTFSFGDDKDDLEKLNEQRDDLNDQLSAGKKKSSQLSSEIKTLEQKIYKSEVSIASLEKEINNTKAEISVAWDELAVKEKEVTKQDDELNQRLRAMYKNGEIGMLSVLLGAASMSDLMTSMDVVERIYDADANLLAKLESQYAEIDDEKNKLLSLMDTLESQQQELEKQKSSMASQKNEVSAKKREIDTDNALLEAQIDELNEEANALTAKILGLQGTGDYVGGTMIWPSEASTRISSEYGMRLHPILKVKKMHTGIDIAAAGGTNILAANSGTVITAGWNNSYGYMVMVDHGGGIVTLYAHSSKLLVKKGEIVTRGQTIAKVGSTGRSTGNHLHFEVRVNGQYVDPMKYVSKSVRK